ncbi:MAG TPA: hypothetical protein VI959_04200, partial [Alphaproteobacteria bacterium]|nr:hypothetical protein [Alphaproteobacteria bacterium]
HGTPDLTSILSMIRNGFYISNSKQGTAVYGPGVYAATDKNVAEEYAKGKGVVLSVPLKLTKDLRILDLGKISETKDLLKTLDCKNNDELFGILQARYDIDAIIPENQPAYLVVQNASILKMPKDFSLLLKKQLKTIDSELKTISSKTSWYDSKEGIDKALNNLHPTGAFRALASMCKVNQEEYHDIFGRYLRKLLEKKPLPVFHILSKGWSYWEDQHEGFVNELASGQKENLPKDFTSNPKKWVELIQRIKIAAGPNVSNNMTFSDLHILEVIKLSQLTDFSEDQDTLINCFYSLKSIVYEINEIIGWRGDLNPFHFWHIFLKVSKNLTNEQRSEVVSTFLSNGKINEWSRKKLHLIKLLTDCVTHKHTEFGYPFNNASLDTTLDGYVAEKFKEILVEFEKVSGSSYLSDPSWDLIEKQGFNTLEILKCLGELKAAVGLNADKFFYKEIFSDFLNSGLMEHKDKESILKMLTMLQQDNYGLTFNKKTTYHTTIFGEPVTHAYDAGIFEVINLVKELSCLDKFGLLNKLCYFKSQNDYMIFDQFKKLYEEQKTMPTCLQGVDLKKEKQGYTTYLGFIGEDALNDEISIYNERLKKIYKKYNEVTFYLID